MAVSLRLHPFDLCFCFFAVNYATQSSRDSQRAKGSTPVSSGGSLGDSLAALNSCSCLLLLFYAPARTKTASLPSLVPTIFP